MRLEFVRNSANEFGTDEWACPHQAALEIIAHDWRSYQTPPFEGYICPFSGEPHITIDYNLR